MITIQAATILALCLHKSIVEIESQTQNESNNYKWFQFRPWPSILSIEPLFSMADGLVPICRQFRAPEPAKVGRIGPSARLWGGGVLVTQPGAAQVGRFSKIGPSAGYEGAGLLVADRQDQQFGPLLHPSLPLLYLLLAIGTIRSYWGYHSVVAMVIHRHIGTHRQSSKKRVQWPKLAMVSWFLGWRIVPMDPKKWFLSCRNSRKFQNEMMHKSPPCN